MARVLVVSTSRKTRGGITAVLNLYEQSKMWRDFHCHWIGTHRDGSNLCKLFYYSRAIVQYVLFLPFYDIVHFHFSLRTTAKRKCPLFKLAKFFRKKTIVHLHCGSQIDDIWNSRYQYMFEHCDCGILLSDSLKNRVEEHIGKTNKLKVVYNPCPIITDNIHYEKKDTILFSGTLYDGKGYKDLIRAFSMIAQNHPEWRVVLAGNGEVEQARTLAQSLGIEKQIEMLGWVSGDEKHRAFSEAKVLCLPSYAEGFPMAVLDAWAYGIPVVTTPVGGVPDVAVDGVNMLLFNPGDIEKLAEKLEVIISDESLRRALSEESLKLAKGIFSLEKVTERVEEIYNQMFEC